MTEELKWIMPDPVDTIRTRLDLLGTYDPEPKIGTNVYENYHYFDDKIFPLTNLAVERYKKLIKVGVASLPKRLYEIKLLKFNIADVIENPAGELLLKKLTNVKVPDKDEEIEVEMTKRVSYREWWTIGAADALCNMLGLCSGYIYWLKKKKKSTRSQRRKKVARIITDWNTYYVEFESCLAQINVKERAQSGYSTAKKRATIQKWVIETAHKICNEHKLKSKSELAEIIYREYYNPDDWETPLKKDGERNTIYRWLINDTTIVIPKN